MAKNPELVMFYNVENLFPPDTDIRDRHNPAFSGLKRWNTDRYKHKIKNISQVFYWVEERYSSLPFLIGLCEIQGRKPLQDLITESPLNGRYEAVHYDSLDERGVDVALLYDRTKVEVLHSEPFRYFFKIGNTENLDTTRDVLYCRLKYLGNPLNVFVLHLPSKRENDINKPKREHILKDIKKRAEKIINETNEPVLLMGDFNENPTSELIMDFCNNGDERLFFNPFYEVYKNRQYSTFHQKNGLLFDQILLTSNLLKKTDILDFNKAKVFTHPKMSSWDKSFKGRPFRTYAGTRYLGGFSDHYPVLVKFNFN